MRLRRTLLALAVLTALLAAAPLETEARCAMQQLGVAALTPLADALPREAGIVLALRPSGTRREADAALGAVTIGTVGMAGGALVEPQPLAPGLAVVSLVGMPPGQHTLRGLGPDEIAFRIADRPLPRAAGAPRAASIRVTNRGRLGIAVSGAITARGAIALTVNAGGTAIAFGLPRDGGSFDLHPFGRCMGRPSGFRAVVPGEAITVRAVDVYGRLSPPSAVVTAE